MILIFRVEGLGSRGVVIPEQISGYFCGQGRNLLTANIITLDSLYTCSIRYLTEASQLDF